MARWRKWRSPDSECVLIAKEKEEQMPRHALIAKDRESEWNWFNWDQECLLRLRFLAKNAINSEWSCLRKTNAKVVRERESKKERRLLKWPLNQECQILMTTSSTEKVMSILAQWPETSTSESTFSLMNNSKEEEQISFIIIRSLFSKHWLESPPLSNTWMAKNIWSLHHLERFLRIKS